MEQNPAEIQVSIQLPVDLAQFMERLQTQVIAKAIEACGGNRSHAAQSLGLKRTTFLSKAKRLGLLPSESKEP
jgi:DNA-binding NtrC family response regulator